MSVNPYFHLTHLISHHFELFYMGKAESRINHILVTFSEKKLSIELYWNGSATLVLSFNKTHALSRSFHANVPRRLTVVQKTLMSQSHQIWVDLLQ